MMESLNNIYFKKIKFKIDKKRATFPIPNSGIKNVTQQSIEGKYKTWFYCVQHFYRKIFQKFQ